ncbi:MAG: hypothetical protein KatS3mg069_0216 [Meiothermus sp.]|nr:MAG: hypothetical protein KatS3mg069_0216 [Meiothermus sp.]
MKKLACYGMVWLALFLAACGGSGGNNGSSAGHWDSAKWDEAKWQ